MSEKEQIALISYLRQQKHSYRQIANNLNANQISTKTGRSWSKHNLYHAFNKGLSTEPGLAEKRRG